MNSQVLEDRKIFKNASTAVLIFSGCSFEREKKFYVNGTCRDLFEILSNCSVKNIRRIYGGLAGNQLPGPVSLFLREPVKLCRMAG